MEAEIQPREQPGIRIDPALPPLALIPARGGSKGIPGKNLQPVGDVPLICRTIQAVKAASTIDRAVVSTEDTAIAEAASSAGAQVVHRPPSLAGDAATSESALLHALHHLGQAGPLPPLFVFLQCTSPFTTSGQIDRVLAALQASKANMAFAVTAWHGFLWGLDAQGWGFGVNHDASRPRQRRQDLAPCYLETGAIYALRTGPFLAAETRFVPPLLPVPVEGPAPEIDTPDDLALCQRLAGLLDPAQPGGSAR
ncbi:cytidylyltransferase domain-containing protein [Cyanobium sp. NIES-981]|uniref:acylneuraminate cytidylyltransferase family protein n=1 Tax=Cyanobium sp. NIES-981 TaxID=1851505 RepID=UPI0007DD5C27|nr:acylneuraminate cytidylyltransferase family protein [Cyanobium sp. NIES-981]SBO44578.1 Acylneuraminate cytidylyltransferase [Cyanobium sp. NIES-981]